MGKRIDLTGERFGRWSVIAETQERTSSGNIKWLCRCDCGVEKTVSGDSLRSGVSVSCGCYNHDVITKDNPKRRRKLYSIYNSIKDRCNNQNSRSYKNYGGRGIKLSNDWDTYDKFEEWCLSNGYNEKLWIDRIDNDGDYSPSNCRFVTPKIQQNNKRTNRLITINGETRNITGWADYSGIKPGTITRRLDLGWSEEHLLDPVDTSRSHPDEIRASKR